MSDDQKPLWYELIDFILPFADDEKRAYSGDKEAVRKLDASIKQQLPGRLSHWSVLNREQARHQYSQREHGVQFFQKAGKTWRPVASASGEWVCLVTDAWLARKNETRTGGGGTVRTTGTDRHDAAPQRHASDAHHAIPGASTAASAPYRTDRTLHLALFNPDGLPMPDARYTVDIHGQKTLGPVQFF